MNIANWLDEAANRWPERPALYRGTMQIADYDDLRKTVRELAGVLHDAYGVQQGDRVVLFMYNCCEYLEWLYAIWWLGAVAVPINCKLHVVEAVRIVEDAQASVLLTDNGHVFSTTDLPVGCKEIAVLRNLRTPLLARPVVAPKVCASDTLAWIFYTSGTTGRSKGAMLSHGNLSAMSLCYPVEVESVSGGDALLYAAPISHGAGLYNFIFIRSGAAHIVPESRAFDPSEIFSIASTLGRVSLFAAPTMVKRMSEEAIRSGYGGNGIRTIVYGGAPMYLADLRIALNAFGPRLVQIYGQGESPMTITALSREAVGNRSRPDWERVASSVGWAQSCVEVKVVDSGFEPVASGLQGEVVVRGATVMQGYWRNEVATRAALVDGWLRTGDVGYVDETGMLTLTDRSKDVIISGGSNIYPREVEEVLAEHPAVEEVAVVGEPDDEWGEIVLAIVVLRTGHEADAVALNRWFTKTMASFKKPKRYLFVAELPKNGYGKIPKTELRRLFVDTKDRGISPLVV